MGKTTPQLPIALPIGITMATKLPRGVAVVKYKLADGTQALKYRVRINRIKDNFKADEYFDTIQGAKDFLYTTKNKKGAQEIKEKLIEKKREQEEDKDNFTLNYFIKLYKEDKLPSREDFTELERRNWNNKVSFYKTIANTVIEDQHSSKWQWGEEDNTANDIDGPLYKKLGDFDIRNISNIEINLYVRERLKTVKKISVQRELTHLSNVFRKLQHYSKAVAKLPNPTLVYDKDLTKDAIIKRKVTHSEKDEELLFDILSKVRNQQYYNIAKLSYMLSLRRSEIVYLTKQQILHNRVNLPVTKTTSRDVYFTKETKDFIDSLPVLGKDGRFFTLTIGGFEKMFREICDRSESTKKFKRFHDIRRTSISRTLTKLAIKDSIVLSQILGFSNIEYLEANYMSEERGVATTQQDVMDDSGHANKSTTKRYLNFNDDHNTNKGK